MFKRIFFIVAVFVFCAAPAWNADKIGKSRKIDKADKVEKIEKTEKVEKAVKVDKTEKAEKAEKVDKVFTQRDLAHMIVSEFGWGDGLPREPQDRDYLVVLNGRRNFRFEAENAYNSKTDRVVVAEYNLYGPFTGKGWLRGVSDRTFATFAVMIPIGGEYTLKAVVCGDDFIWAVGDKKYRGGSAGNFKEVNLGTMKVKPGVLQIKVDMPPMGGIDSFSFIAPDIRPIQPFAGWRFREPLVAERLAEVAVSLMNLYSHLPDDKQFTPKSLAAIDAAQPSPDAASSTVTFLGPFSSRAWLRADFNGAVLQMPLKVEQAGFYGVRARTLGETIEGDVNGFSFSVAGKPYLDLLDLGLFKLESGDNVLTLRLPPMGGVDVVSFSRKRTTSADFMTLAGLDGAPDRQVGLDEAQKLIKAIHAVRK